MGHEGDAVGYMVVRSDGSCQTSWAEVVVGCCGLDRGWGRGWGGGWGVGVGCWFERGE